MSSENLRIEYTQIIELNFSVQLLDCLWIMDPCKTDSAPKCCESLYCLPQDGEWRCIEMLEKKEMSS